MTTAYSNQVGFRGRGDTQVLSSAVFDYLENTNWSQLVDEVFRIRFEVEESNNKNFTWNAPIEYSLNSGAWTSITTTSSVVKAVPSSQFNEGDLISSNLLTGSALTWVNGYGCEDGTPFTIALSNSQSECEFSIQIVGADVADSDTIQIRVSNLNAWTVIPTITVSKPSNNDLVAIDLVAGIPTIDQPTIGHPAFDLVAVDIFAGVPTIDKPDIAVVQAVIAKDLVAGIPTIDQPTIGHPPFDLVAVDIVTGVPTIDQATLDQPEQNELASKDLVAGVPTIDKPNLILTQNVVSKDLVAGVPTIEKPDIAVAQAIEAKDLVAGIPTIEKPDIAVVQAIEAVDITAGIPVIDDPVLSQLFGLVAMDITAGIPTIDKPSMGYTEPVVFVLPSRGSLVMVLREDLRGLPMPSRKGFK